MIEEAISEKDIPLPRNAFFVYAKFKCKNLRTVADLRGRKNITVSSFKSYDAYNMALRANNRAASEVAEYIEKSLSAINCWKINIRINSLHLLVWNTKENLQRIAKIYKKEIKQHEQANL